MFTSAPGSVKDAVKSVQEQINLFKPGTFLVIDGIVGPLTRGAYRALKDDQRRVVDKLATARNSGLLAELRAAEPSLPAQGSQTWVSLAEAKALISRAISKYGDIPGYSAMEHLSKSLMLEPQKRGSGAGIQFLAESRSTDPRTKQPGAYYGLYQLGRAAYADVVATRKIPDLPLFQVAVYSPWFNTAMALVYAQVLVNQLRSSQTDRKTRVTYPPYSGPITREILYGAHNQGSLGLKMGAANAKAGGQSKDAGPVIAAAVAQMKSVA